MLATSDHKYMVGVTATALFTTVYGHASGECEKKSKTIYYIIRNSHYNIFILSVESPAGHGTVTSLLCVNRPLEIVNVNCYQCDILIKFLVFAYLYMLRSVNVFTYVCKKMYFFLSQI